MINSINSSYNNPLINLKNSVRIKQENHHSSNQNLNTDLVSSKDLSKSSTTQVLGYTVDKNGYFTEEFNKAAGIPSDYKIHSSTMESLVNTMTDKTKNPMRIYRNLDIAKTIGNAYKILLQVVGENVLNSKDSFSAEEIAKFPQGYKFNTQTMQVSEVYSNIVDFTNHSMYWSTPIGGRPDRMNISSLFYNSSPTNPTTDVFNNANGGATSNVHFDMTRDKYTNPDGSITKGGLLIGVINANLHTREGETTANGKSQGYDKSMSYIEIINYDASKDPTSTKGEFYVTGLRPLKIKRSEESLRVDKEWEEYVKNYKDPLQIFFEELQEQQKLSLEELERKRKELKAQNIKNLDMNA